MYLGLHTEFKKGSFESHWSSSAGLTEGRSESQVWDSHNGEFGACDALAQNCFWDRK